MSLADQLLQYALSGLVVGGIYALIGLGFVIVYSVTRVINFAQGEFVMLGALLMVTFGDQGLPLPLAFLLVLLAASGIGALLERVAIHPVRSASVLTLIIITIGASIALRGAALLVWGTDPFALPPFSPGPPLHFGQAILVRQGLWVLAVALAIFVGLWAFFTRSRLGIQMRATAESPRLAAQGGVDIHRVFAVSWAISTFAAGTAGVLYAANVRLDPEIGVIGLKAFPVALVGGLDSLAGIVPAALAIALLENLAIRYVDPLLSEVVPFLVLLGMLMIRPWGLFGTHEEMERV